MSYVEIREQVKQATLIIVGTVESEHMVRTVASWPRDDFGQLALRAVRLRVEGVLEGQFNGDHLLFYYYQVTGAWNGPEPNMVIPEERGIFYVVKDGKEWRATTDAYASHTRVVTGTHSISATTNKDEVRDTITQLLLVPGQGGDLSAFLGLLGRNSVLAMGLVGETRVSQILRSLLTNSKPDIRGRACIILAEFPFKETSCLPEVMRDVHTLPDDRKRAQELMLSLTVDRE